MRVRSIASGDLLTNMCSHVRQKGDRHREAAGGYWRRNAAPGWMRVRPLHSGARPGKIQTALLGSIDPVSTPPNCGSAVLPQLVAFSRAGYCLLCDHLADGQGCGRCRRRRVENVEHALGSSEQEIVDQRSVPPYRLGSDSWRMRIEIG